MSYVASPALTLENARDEYFRANDFGADGGYGAAWVDFKLGPIPMPFPNTPGRRRAVRFHDLHHVLTGYATDVRGELEISAWEVGGGCADFWSAWQLNLGGLVGGLIACPRRTWRAFVRGRHSRNLYRGATYDGALLGRRVDEVRRELGLDGAVPAGRAGDAAALALAAAAGVALGGAMFVLMLPIAIVANVAALFLRRPGRSIA
jgi:hypothetical protein